MEKGISLKFGTKNGVPKNNNKNKETLKLYASFSVSPEKEKQALLLTIECVSGEEFSIGELEKPKSSGNKGDVAEGILGAAITARFINKNNNISKEDVKRVLSSLGSNITKIKEKNFDSPNKNPKIKDTVKFYLSLAESNMKYLLDQSSWNSLDSIFDSSVKYANGSTVVSWSKLLYENNQKNSIEVLSDGLGNQTGTKVDVRVKVDGKDTNVNLSLKAGDVKQFGQVSGSTFDKQISLWDTLIGYDVSNLEKKYTELLSNKKVNEAIYLVYRDVCSHINRSFKSKTEKRKLLINLGKGIEMFATRKEENVVLLQLNNREAKIYTFSNLYDVIKEIDLVAELKDSSGKPKLVIKDKRGKVLIEIRVKAEGRPDGSVYIRNYVEKGDLLTELISVYA
jgi:hypothetical protein